MFEKLQQCTHRFSPPVRVCTAASVFRLNQADRWPKLRESSLVPAKIPPFFALQRCFRFQRQQFLLVQFLGELETCNGYSTSTRVFSSSGTARARSRARYENPWNSRDRDKNNPPVDRYSRASRVTRLTSGRFAHRGGTRLTRHRSRDSEMTPPPPPLPTLPFSPLQFQPD